MPSFYDLPLSKIIAALYPDPYEPPTALSRLCRTSRPLAAIITPHLYRTPNCTKWWLLARTLLACPDLRSYVRDLVDGEYWRYIEDDDTSVPPELLAYRDERLEDAFVDETDLHRHRLELLASLCPKIARLEGIVGVDPPFARFPPRFFRRLEEAHFRYEDTEFGIEFTCLEELADAAPNLKRITCAALASSGPVSETFSRVTELRLTYSTIRADSLRNLLAACPNLTTFAFEAGGSTVGHDQFTPREAQDILASHAPQLKSLTMRMAAWFANLRSGDLIGPDVLMDSLAPLGSLETMSLDARCLVPHLDPHGRRYVRAPDGSLVPAFQGEVPLPPARFLADLLPASVRSFEVVEGAGARMANLRLSLLDLAAVAGERFPGLKRLTVSAHRVDGESVDEVKAAFEARGIHFEEA